MTLQIHDVLTSYWEYYGVPDGNDIQMELLNSSHENSFQISAPTINTTLCIPPTMKSAKFMDDATCQEIIDINTCLCSNINRSGPLPFCESSGKILPPQNSLLQNEINRIKLISDQREMKLNAKKTCLFLVNFTKNHQFKPLLYIPGEFKPLEVVQETKLLGYWLTSDMKPKTHISYIVSIANKRMWVVCKLKHCGVSDSDLKEFFIVKQRSVLETAAPVFHSMMTLEDSNDIERVQKNVVRIILAERYTNYEDGLTILGLETLLERRKTLCLNFALKCLGSSKYNGWFQKTPKIEYNIRETREFLEPQCQLDRYMDSPIPYLTRLLNEYFADPTS